MQLLGHVSATMSLRYGRLFDATVRAEYERALTQAKAQLGPAPLAGMAAPPAGPVLPLTAITGDADWKDSPTIKSRLAGGFCLRAPAQGTWAYANICEHCHGGEGELAMVIGGPSPAWFPGVPLDVEQGRPEHGAR